MTQQNVLELAKQGNPQAIAALLNRNLQAQGITAKVVLKNKGALQILLEAGSTPNPDQMVGFIQQGLNKLQPAGVQSIMVFGRETGSEMPDWSREVSLSSQPLITTPPLIQAPLTQVQHPVTQSPVSQPTTPSQPKAATKPPQPTAMAPIPPGAKSITPQTQAKSKMGKEFQSLVVAVFVVSLFLIPAIIGIIASPLAAWLLYWTFYTPGGKAYALQFNTKRAQEREHLNAKRAQEREHLSAKLEAFREEVRTIEQRWTAHPEDPSIKESAKSVFALLDSSLWVNLNYQDRWGTIKLLMSVAPETPIWDFAFKKIKLAAIKSNVAYSFALEVLESNPTLIRAKQFALDVGRYHHSCQRKDKRVTIYDEQAIQNDIQVRSR